MTIDKLFEELEEYFMFEDINGEFTLNNTEIVWNYTLDETETEEEIDEVSDEPEEYFDETKSSEELLIDAYEEDVEKIRMFLDEIGESDNWVVTDPEISDDNISLTIA